MQTGHVWLLAGVLAAGVSIFSLWYGRHLLSVADSDWRRPPEGNYEIMIDSQPAPKSAELPAWRTLDLSSQATLAAFKVSAVQLVFESKGGRIEGMVKAPGGNKVYPFDSESRSEVAVPLTPDQMVVEFAITSASPENTKYSVKLKGFNYSAPFLTEGV